jgi:hypothetical protein
MAPFCDLPKAIVSTTKRPGYTALNVILNHKPECPRLLLSLEVVRKITIRALFFSFTVHVPSYYHTTENTVWHWLFYAIFQDGEGANIRLDTSAQTINVCASLQAARTKACGKTLL